MLAELIPERLRKIPELMAVIGAEEPETQAAYDATVDFLAQLNVDTATWGLDLWEFEYGIQTDASKSLDARRTALKAKMRGAATTTAAQIRRIVNAYTGNDSCEVTEYPREYLVGVSYTLVPSAQERIDACRASLREVLPAHLDFVQQVSFPIGQIPLYVGGTMDSTATIKLPPLEV